MNKSDQGEFNFIEDIRKSFSHIVPFGVDGIGDDCAVIPISDDESFVVTTDMLVEGIHFLRNKISAYELGRKSLAVNLSDVASMGATPMASFLSVALPADMNSEWKSEFMSGYKSMSEQFSTPLLGGDTTSSIDGVAINVTAIGRVKNANIKRRSDAKYGDLVVVSGNLGDSAAGFLTLSIEDPTAAESFLKFAHHDPAPHVEQGQWLGTRSEVHAMMDVSDGIASDLTHILKASNRGATVELESDIMTDRMKTVCEKHGWDAKKLAFAGGEDYVLLMTVDPERYEDLSRSFFERFKEPLHVIGRITDGEPIITWTENGTQKKVDYKGFSHTIGE